MTQQRTPAPAALIHAAWLEKSLTIGAPEAASELRRLHEVEKQRDELLAELAEAKRSAEFNFEQYQDVGRLLHEECEKTEKLLAAMIHIQQVACSGSPELGIAIDAIASVKGKQ